MAYIHEEPLEANEVGVDGVCAVGQRIIEVVPPSIHLFRALAKNEQFMSVFRPVKSFLTGASYARPEYTAVSGTSST